MTTCHRIMSPSNYKISRGLSELVCDRPVNSVHFSTSIQTELIITDHHPVHLKTAITLVGLDNNFLSPDLNFLTVHLHRVCLYILIFHRWIDHTSWLILSWATVCITQNDQNDWWSSEDVCSDVGAEIISCKGALDSTCLSWKLTLVSETTKIAV